MEAELDRDSQVIDREKAKAEQMASQLENLEREIEQKKLYLNQESQLDIDEYNSKVGTYNGLLERVRAQSRLVKQLVESYNEKLRQHSR
jgi:chromosome segregation ATPase